MDYHNNSLGTPIRYPGIIMIIYGNFSGMGQIFLIRLFNTHDLNLLYFYSWSIYEFFNVWYSYITHYSIYQTLGGLWGELPIFRRKKIEIKTSCGPKSRNESNWLKNHGVSCGIKKLLTNGEGPINDKKSKLFNLGI